MLPVTIVSSNFLILRETVTLPVPSVILTLSWILRQIVMLLVTIVSSNFLILIETVTLPVSSIILTLSWILRQIVIRPPFLLEWGELIRQV